MTVLTKRQREYIGKEKFYKRCIHTKASNNLEMEHALYYAGKKIQEVFAVVPVQKEYNRNPSAETKGFHRWVALWRFAFAEQSYRDRIQEKYPKYNFLLELINTEARFGYRLEDYPELEKMLRSEQILTSAL